MKLLTEQELRKNIEGIILSWSSEISGEQREKLHPETDQLVLRHIDLINSEVLQALEEVKSKQVEIFPCDCQFNKGFAYKKGDPCDGSCVLAPYRERVVSAIDEVERKYRNE